MDRIQGELGIDAELRTSLIEYVLGCRLYRLEYRFAGQPEERWVREALLRAAGHTGHS